MPLQMFWRDFSLLVPCSVLYSEFRTVLMAFSTVSSAGEELVDTGCFHGFMGSKVIAVM